MYPCPPLHAAYTCQNVPCWVVLCSVAVPPKGSVWVHVLHGRSVQRVSAVPCANRLFWGLVGVRWYPVPEVVPAATRRVCLAVPPRPTAVREGGLPPLSPQSLPRRWGRGGGVPFKAVEGGYCRLQMPLSLALAVRETWLGTGRVPWRGVPATAQLPRAKLRKGGGEVRADAPGRLTAHGGCARRALIPLRAGDSRGRERTAHTLRNEDDLPAIQDLRRERVHSPKAMSKVVDSGGWHERAHAVHGPAENISVATTALDDQNGPAAVDRMHQLVLHHLRRA